MNSSLRGYGRPQRVSLSWESHLFLLTQHTFPCSIEGTPVHVTVCLLSPSPTLLASKQQDFTVRCRLHVCLPWTHHSQEGCPEPLQRSPWILCSLPSPPAGLAPGRTVLAAVPVSCAAHRHRCLALSRQRFTHRKCIYLKYSACLMEGEHFTDRSPQKTASKAVWPG